MMVIVRHSMFHIYSSSLIPHFPHLRGTPPPGVPVSCPTSIPRRSHLRTGLRTFIPKSFERFEKGFENA